MNKPRLTRLTHLLYKVHEENKPFDLAYWVGRGLLPGDGVETLTEIPCGFAACAIGYAAADETFRKEGFTLSHNDVWFVPAFGVYKGWIAVEEFFDLGYYEAFDLFDEESYPYGYTAKDVADRIMEFVNS